MKKLLLYVVAIIIMAPAITSCKKGEEDPFLSLRSRKARLVGEWKLVSGSLALSAGNEVYETSFNGSIATINYGLQQGSIQYSETVTFDKNNAYKIEIVTDGVFESDEGFWSFMTGYGEIANKEYVVLRIAKSIEGVNFDMYSGDNMPVKVLRLLKLSNKEVIVEAKGTDFWNGVQRNFYSTKTYEKQ